MQLGAQGSGRSGQARPGQQEAGGGGGRMEGEGHSGRQPSVRRARGGPLFCGEQGVL